MEAPEKIYVHRTVHLGLLSGSEMNITGNDIEYARTDAFIEKACELLDKMVSEITYESLEGDSVQHYDKMEFIENFKNYMKGE